MRAGQAALILVVMFLPALVCAQSGTDTSLVIPVHPRVRTILQLPDAIENAWITDRDDFRMAIVGKQLYVRPRPGTPAGVEALLEVKTRALRRTFQLRVVARARDASLDVLVLPVEEERDTGESTPEVPPEVPVAAAPAASTPANAPSPLPATEHDAADTRRGDAVAGPPRFDLSAHVVVALGVTALELAGYEPRAGLQHHQALGLRLAGAPRGRWWAVELDVSAERLVGSFTYEPGRDSSSSSILALSGPWLRAMLGTRARLEVNEWTVSAQAGIGALAHLRKTKTLEGDDSSTMALGGVLALGMGVQYRARDVLLGVEFRVLQGGPDEYRSIEALLTVGRFLSRGDAP